MHALFCGNIQQITQFKIYWTHGQVFLVSCTCYKVGCTSLIELTKFPMPWVFLMCPTHQCFDIYEKLMYWTFTFMMSCPLSLLDGQTIHIHLESYST
jgi:hypothetical protein